MEESEKNEIINKIWKIQWKIKELKNINQGMKGINENLNNLQKMNLQKLYQQKLYQ